MQPEEVMQILKDKRRMWAVLRSAFYVQLSRDNIIVVSFSGSTVLMIRCNCVITLLKNVERRT